jgi:circadian clock protein KaiB
VTENSANNFEQALRDQREGRYLLRLYTTGMTPRSLRAIQNIKTICEEHLKGRYELEIIDIYQNPASAQSNQIVAAPTLVKMLPEPLRRLIGDLSDVEKVLVGLDLRPIKDEQPAADGEKNRGS